MLNRPGPSSPEHTFFRWLRDSKKNALDFLDDISVLSLWFHWVIFGFLEKHASICSRSTSTPCLYHSPFQRPENPGIWWPGLENEKRFQWTILNVGMESESMCRSTRDLTCIICTWWWNSLYSYSYGINSFLAYHFYFYFVTVPFS